MISVGAYAHGLHIFLPDRWPSLLDRVLDAGT